jgi:hypothetical protein
MIHYMTIAVALGLALISFGQNKRPTDIPTNLQAPEGEEVILQAHASGSQIYVCQAGADQKLAWTLKAPEAELQDAQGAVIGHHYAGPAWKHTDGSEVTGAVSARQDAPDPDAIPWLLLRATGHSGNGILSRVTTIQRIHTKGGRPPGSATCDESTRGHEVKSSYSADYYFYAPAGSSSNPRAKQ